MKLQQSISSAPSKQWIGRELVLLAEGESEETPLLWEGRTQFHAPEIDGKVYINDFGDLRIPRTRPLLQSPDHRSPRLRRSRQNPLRPTVNPRTHSLRTEQTCQLANSPSPRQRRPTRHIFSKPRVTHPSDNRLYRQQSRPRRVTIFLRTQFLTRCPCAAHRPCPPRKNPPSSSAAPPAACWSA